MPSFKSSSASASRKLSSSPSWWHALTDLDDPITLEPISTLPHPPFLLSPNYFDALALSSYMVSRFTFTNPLTRVELTKIECKDLDSHVAEHYGKNCAGYGVLEAFRIYDHMRRKDSKSGDGAAIARRDVLRQSAAMALQSLFRFDNIWGRGGASNAISESDDGGLRIIDDNQLIVQNADTYEANIIDAENNRFNTSHSSTLESFPDLTEAATQKGLASGSSQSNNLPQLMTFVEEAGRKEREENIRRAAETEQFKVTEGVKRRERAEERERVKQLYSLRIEDKKTLNREARELEGEGRAEIERFRDELFDLMIEEREREEEIKAMGREEARRKVRAQIAADKERALVRVEEERRLNVIEQGKIEDEKVKVEKDKKATKKLKTKATATAIKASETKAGEEKKKRLATKDAEKKATVKCELCKKGILDVKNAFVKFEKMFCSSACSRAFVPV